MVPSLTLLLHLGLVLLVMAMFQVIGAALIGRNRLAELDLLVGWAAVGLVFTLWGVITDLPFLPLAIAFPVAAIAAFALARLRGVAIGWNDCVPVVVVALPLLLQVAAMKPSDVDDLNHWLPNAHYILNVDHFPGPGRPAPTSNWPAYPYGMAFVTYLVGMAVRPFGLDWIANTNTMTNTILLLVAARIVIDALAHAWPAAFWKNHRWAAAALGFLIVTLLSPSFSPKVALTSLADSATSVVVLAAVHAYGRLATTEREGPRQMSIMAQWAWMLILLAELKQQNLALIAICVAIALVWEARNGRWRRGAMLAMLCIFSVALYILWQAYVRVAIPNGQMEVASIGRWHFDYLGETINGMTSAAWHKPGFTFAMLAILAVALWRFWLRFDKRSEMEPAVFAAAALWVGYNVFLLVAYLAVIDPAVYGFAISVWRFNIHVGLAGSLALSLVFIRVAQWWAARRGWHSFPAWGGAGLVAVAIIVSVAAAPLIRFDLSPETVELRRQGEEMAALLPPDATVTLAPIGPSSTYCPTIRYLIGGQKRMQSCVSPDATADLQQYAAAAPCLWINGWVPSATVATGGLTLPADQAHLLCRQDGAWREVRAWPRIMNKTLAAKAPFSWRLFPD